jgi:hypothetical protein
MPNRTGTEYKQIVDKKIGHIEITLTITCEVRLTERVGSSCVAFNCVLYFTFTCYSVQQSL